MGDGMSDGSYCSGCKKLKRECICSRLERKRREDRRRDVRAAIKELDDAEVTLAEAKKSIAPATERHQKALDNLDSLIGR